MDPISCSLCTDPETSENPIITCGDCNLKVHILCYGIESFDGNWMCSPCAVGVKQAVCKLCVQDGGALKKTTCGGWAHVLCGLFIEGCSFLDNNLMEPIDISNVSDTKRNKTCMFCQNDRGFAPLCSKTKCKNRLHISCANKNGCLKEEQNKVSETIKFRAYCLDHKPVDLNRRISAEFVRGAVKSKYEKSDKAKKGARDNSEKEKSSTMNIQWLIQKSVNANESSSNEKRKQKREEPTTSDGNDHSKRKKVSSFDSPSSLRWDSYDLKNYNQYSVKALSLGSIFPEENEENVQPHVCDKDKKINKVSKTLSQFCH